MIDLTLSHLLPWIVIAGLLFLLWMILKRGPKFSTAPVTQHDEQIIAINDPSVTFGRKPILWPKEYRTLKLAEKVVKQYGRRDCHLWAQVNLGELITVESVTSQKAWNARSSINSKRSDIVLTDSKGYALALIEYQGAGHYNDTAVKRDKVKRLAAQRAGVAFIEIMGHWSDPQIEAELSRALRGVLSSSVLESAQD